MKLFKKLFHTFVSDKNSMYSENKILIAGLGNIGERYYKTRHNAGFYAADAISVKFKGTFTEARFGQISKIRIRNKQIIVLKPATYMNLSGKALRYYIDKEKIMPENFIVISDDLALPFGQVRVRKKGGAGGHNGLQNIIDTLGTTEFSRIRIGIGSDFAKGYQSDYVLDDWSDVQLKQLPEIMNSVVSACETFVLEGIDNSMNKFNIRDVHPLSE